MAEKNSEQQRNFYEKLERVAIELKEKEDGPEKDLIRIVLEDKLDVDFDLYNLDSFSNSDEGIIANATGWISEKKVSYPVNRGFLISNSKIEFAKELILEIQQKLTLYFEFYEGRKEVLENILNEKETKSKNFEERLTEKDKEFLKEIQDTELFKKTFNEIRQEFIDQMSKCTDVDEEGKNKCLKELTQSFLPFDLDIWITKATLYKLKKDNAPVPKWLTATVKVKITVKNK